MSYNVGINVIETDGRATPSIVPAPTSVAGFSIRSRRGVFGKAFRITNLAQFVERFGGHIAGAYGAYAIKGFFDNGGTKAYVTRVLASDSNAPSPATLLSNEGPWNLEPAAADTLTFTSDALDEGNSVDAIFQWNPAEIVGKAGPFNLEAESGNGKALVFVLNENAERYQFRPEDFGGRLDNIPVEQVAVVINREFSGLQAYVGTVEHVGKLIVRTDRGDAGYSLTIRDPEPEETDAPSALPDLFGDAGAYMATASGNVANIDAITPEEAVAVIREALNPYGSAEGISVKLEGKKVLIEHPEPGASGTLAVAGNAADGANRFTFEFTPGTVEGAVALPGAASAYFNGPPNNLLHVQAGYRGDEDPGEWGEQIKVEITDSDSNSGLFTIAVYFQGEKMEVWGDVRMDEPKPGDEGKFVEAVINDPFSGSKFIRVTAEGQVPPQNASPTALTGGLDGVPPSQQDFAKSFDVFETKEIQLLCCPESSDGVVVTAGKDHCEAMGDRMFVGHTPESSSDFDAVMNYSDTHRGKKVYAALYFPWIQVADPLGVHKWIPPTGHILGVFARTERQRGIWKAPAGNAANVRGALNVKAHITDKDHTDMVKEASVNAVRYFPGKGIIIDSSRTLSTNPLWYYVNIRLLFNFVKTSLKDGLTWVVQEPNDQALWNKIKYNSVRPFLMSLWRRGAFGPGAPEEVFEIKIDSENNTPEMYQQGTLKIEVYFYPNRPAETIVIVVGQQEGGATAAES